MSETLADLRSDYDELRARWKDGEPWLKARTGDAYRAWFRQSVREGRPPDALRKYSPVESERFFARVIPGPDGHSYWNGGERFQTNDRKERMPRRWWWEHVHGPITDRGVPKPVCGEPHCITIDHLELKPWSDIKRKFTDEQCIGALQVAALRLGRTPTMDEYDAFGLKPSSSGIRLRYSSWNRAIEAAGLPVAENSGKFVQVYADLDFFNAVRTFREQHGFTPSGEHWKRERLTPLYSTIYHRFKGWRNFLRAAGLGE